MKFHVYILNLKWYTLELKWSLRIYNKKNQDLQWKCNESNLNVIKQVLKWDRQTMGLQKAGYSEENGVYYHSYVKQVRNGNHPVENNNDGIKKY